MTTRGSPPAAPHSGCQSYQGQASTNPKHSPAQPALIALTSLAFIHRDDGQFAILGGQGAHAVHDRLLFFDLLDHAVPRLGHNTGVIQCATGEAYEYEPVACFASILARSANDGGRIWAILDPCQRTKTKPIPHRARLPCAESFLSMMWRH